MRAGLLLVLACGGAAAQPVDWDASFGVTHRTLRELDPNFARLVRESGPMGEVEARVHRGAFRAHGRLASGRLDYEGRTQAGAPLDTRSRHDEAEIGVDWDFADFGRWGVLSAGLSQLWLRRAIAGTPIAAGLAETSSVTLTGLAWRSAPQGDWRWQVEGGWRGSIRHRLDVDFRGAFDNASITSGHRNETLLRVSATPAERWTVSLGWRHVRQSPSDLAPLSRAGAVVGTLREPRLRIDDATLSLRRSF